MALEYRDGQHLVIQAELPGIDPERDLEVSIRGDVLHIRAARDAGREPPGHPSDLRYGTFVRDIPLPPATVESQVSATYRKGKLEVRVPLGESRRVAAVAIRVQHD